MSLHSPSGKKERKRGTRNKIGPSQLSNPSRPRLQELRNLPQRGLGLRWVSDDRKFQVVKLQQSTTNGSPGPAATVVRPDPDGVLEATGGSKLPSLDEVKGSVVAGRWKIGRLVVMKPMPMLRCGTRRKVFRWTRTSRAARRSGLDVSLSVRS